MTAPPEHALFPRFRKPRLTLPGMRAFIIVATAGLAHTAQAQMGPPPGTAVGAQLPPAPNSLLGPITAPANPLSGVQIAPAPAPLLGNQMRPGQSPYAAAIPAAAIHPALGGPSIIPPPPVLERADPKRISGQPARSTQAKQQFVNPERAYDPQTGESFFWDCAKKSWIDSRTHQAVGFQGGKAIDGEVIPPPPKLELADSERLTDEGLMARITQARQEADNPARAYDPDSKQFLVWDRRQKNWIDTQTGEAIGFLGRKGVTACQPSIAEGIPPNQAGLAHAPVLNELLFKEHVAIASSDSFFLSAGMGQALLQMELLLTSKQSVIGGSLRLIPPTPPAAEAKAGPELPTHLQLSKATAASPL